MLQPNTVEGIRSAVASFGPAPGAAQLMDREMMAAKEAIESGMYVTYRSTTHQKQGGNGLGFCTRVPMLAKCFCGHELHSHAVRKPMAPCNMCSCRGYAYIPFRPEEIGEWWLPRRKGFDIKLWKAQCKCSHSGEEHDPQLKHCRYCGCRGFVSNFLCVVCDQHWEDHETFIENEMERKLAGQSIGEAFLPLHSTPEIQRAVFDPQARANPRIRPKAAMSNPEKSVRLMAKHNGGKRW